MPALIGGYASSPWQSPAAANGQQKQYAKQATCAGQGDIPPPGYLVSSRSQPTHLVGHPQFVTGHEGSALSAGTPLYGPPSSAVICRRQSNYYLLLTLLILGIAILVFIVVASSIVYITHPCASLDCLFGAECVIESNNGREVASCRCEEICSHNFVDAQDRICGSNGETYDTECHLRVASCSLQTSLYVRSNGACDKRGNIGGGSELAGSACRAKCEFGSTCESRSGMCRCPENCLDYPQVRDYFEARSPGLPVAQGLLQEDDPFCGTEGRDYKNLCELKKASCSEGRSVQVKFKGKCDPCAGIRCPGNQLCQLDENRNPICACNENKCSFSQDNGVVCGSDGKTYPNECFLEDRACRTSKKIRIISRGECKEGSHPCLKLNCSEPLDCNVDRFGVSACVCPQPCPKIYRPVCGSDHQTYDSFCHLQRKACLSQTNTSLLYIGTCNSGDEQTDVIGPTCSANTCHFGGACVKDESTREIKCVCGGCPNENEPVCGTDHMSYESACLLRKASCEQQKALEVAYQGLCRGCEDLQCKHYAVCEINSYGMSECVCPQVCIHVDAPESRICASDGNTYDNECAMRVRSCKLQIKLTVKTLGPCDACQTMNCKHGARCEAGRCVCPTNCPEGIFEPICANDGTTYKSECELRKIACLNEMDLRALFYGECDDADEPGGAQQLPGDNGGGSGDGDAEDGLVAEERAPVVAVQSARARDTCAHHRCAFGGLCRYNAHGQPFCACHFDCEGQLKRSRGRGEKVCAEGRVFTSECALREESCKRQIEIMRDESCAVASLENDDQSGEECFCNKHGSVEGTRCSETKCKCRPGVGGSQCDRCEPGFWGLNRISEGTSGCIQCDCSHYGAARDDCEQMSGRCSCKPNVLGLKCDTCPRGMILTAHGCIADTVAQPSLGNCNQLNCVSGAKCHQTGRLAQCVCSFDCVSEGELQQLHVHHERHVVCGSDGIVYSSTCLLKQAACHLQAHITVVREGPC